MPFVKESKTPEFKIDLDSNIVVPVICSYDINGKCTPLYFGYAFPNGDKETIKIDYVEYIDSNPIFGYTYTCTVTAHNHQQVIKLFHYEKEHKWFLRNF